MPLSNDRDIFFADSRDLKVTTDTLNAFATYGVTDRLDRGVAVSRLGLPFLEADCRLRASTLMCAVAADQCAKSNISGAKAVVPDALYHKCNNRLSDLIAKPEGDARKNIACGRRVLG